MGMVMKRFLSIWGFGTALLLLPTVVSSTANVTVNFQGSFVNPTCSFSVNNGNSVNLGTYSNTYFNTNTSTPIVGIPIAATGCITGISTIHLSFSGTADSSNNQLFAANSGSGVAGVAIELLAASTQSTRITPGSSPLTGRCQSKSTHQYLQHHGAFLQDDRGRYGGNVNVPITINFTYN
jgi:type 1 fimbria pilin